ncbi:ADAMTS-like protein 1 [Portunus trituberculatus]|uniref:ADAMTS-like protein 1 n=1 Tax=Portunus trituberculatus TaxID=210409 RepID=A0A5B7K4V7_PORTR|nr:ADAMTS-like protein 1 [Portunus trituberculatus]
MPRSGQVTPRQVQVDAGGRLELKCHVSGSPVEAVIWYKDGAEVRPEGRVSLRPRDTLRIAPVVASDAGLYQCAATHAHQYAHAHAHVTLGGK